MIKGILFDLDGTLIDTNSLILSSFKHTFKKHLNFVPEDSEIVKFFGEPLDKSLLKYGKDNVENLVASYRAYNDERHDIEAKEFDGVKETLDKLKARGIKLAIVTSKRRIMSVRGLELFGLTEYFDVIITPENTQLHKPNKEPALKACELLKIKPSEAIFVGDSHNDILCGKNSGTKTCLVTYTVLELEELKSLKPDYVVDNIVELLDIII